MIVPYKGQAGGRPLRSSTLEVSLNFLCAADPMGHGRDLINGAF